MSKFRFLWVVVASGAIIMALEILSARILSPTFGSSVYVWGSIISVFLAALSLGYLLGGSLADRAPKLATLGRLLLLASLLEIVLLCFGAEATSALGLVFGTSRYGSLAATALLFGPITTLLATVSPFAIRLAAREVESLGNVSGRLFALSTAGSLFGTLGCTFVLIPFLDVQQALLLLVALTVLTTAAAMAGEGRDGWLVTGTALAAFVVGLLYVSAPESNLKSLHYKRMTPYQTLEVRDRGDLRYLYSDGITHSAIRLVNGEPHPGYIRGAIIPLVFNLDIERIAVLGLGSGSFVGYLQEYLPEAEMTAVEIDPAVVEIAERFFGFSANERVRIVNQDARRFLSSEDETFDLIFSDTYLGLSVPFHLTTLEFTRLLRQRLSPDGMLMVNVAAGLEDPFTRALYSTLGKEFRHTYVFRPTKRSGNLLVVATDGSLPRFSKNDLVERALSREARFPYSDPSLSDVAANLLEVDWEVREEDILRDDFAPVDHLIHLGRRRAADRH